MLTDQQLKQASFGLWLAEDSTDNHADILRVKRMVPIVMKECCTEKQMLYITHFSPGRSPFMTILTFCVCRLV